MRIDWKFIQLLFEFSLRLSHSQFTHPAGCSTLSLVYIRICWIIHDRMNGWIQLLRWLCVQITDIDTYRIWAFGFSIGIDSRATTSDKTGQNIEIGLRKHIKFDKNELVASNCRCLPSHQFGSSVPPNDVLRTRNKQTKRTKEFQNSTRILFMINKTIAVRLQRSLRLHLLGVIISFLFLLYAQFLSFYIAWSQWI